MMELFNPYFRTALEFKVAQHKPAVDAWLKLPAQAAQRIITLAELRAGLPLIAADLTRPVVNQIMQELGVKIKNPEDAEA